MKYFLLILCFVSFASTSFAALLEAKPVSALIKAVEYSTFTQKEPGLVFGFVSIKSCLFVSDELIILKNYCVPAHDYPAKGYTIFSREFGIIDFYQEQTGSELKRDILISTFPEILKEYLNSPLSTYNIESLNVILEKLYYKNDPACWSTNLSFSTGLPVVECSAAGVLNFESWATETQALTGSLSDWKKLVKSIENSISK